MNIETEKVSVPRFLNMFRKFSASDKLKIADKIDEETFAERWSFLDLELPDVEISDEEIRGEVQTVRHGKTKAS